MVVVLLVTQKMYGLWGTNMNGRKAKLLRRRALSEVYWWYKSLLPDEQQMELTPELAVQYTPIVSYWTETHEKFHPKVGQYASKQTRVSEGTQRWFYLQEKKHARR